MSITLPSTHGDPREVAITSPDRAAVLSGIRTFVAIGVALATAALAIRPASANGRFPTSVNVHFRPGNAQDIYLSTTFGLLVSHDDGAQFRWLCEQNVGYQGTFDPKYRIGADGTIFATTFEGLRISRDGGCSFETATASTPATDPGHVAGRWVDAIDVGSDGAVWIGTADAGRDNEIYRSADGGAAFAPLGLSSSVIWWKSIVVAPADARRAFVSGYELAQSGTDGGVPSPAVHVYRTDDAGQTWTPLPVGAFELSTSPLVLIEAIDPDDPDVVFARSVRAALGGDKLYRSIDAGLTWTEVLATTDTITSVVVRADGNPLQGEVLVATITGGTHRSTDRGAVFVAVPNAPQAACLGDRGDSLFACGANWDPDFFSLGRSPDATSWSKVFRFVDLKGPLSCPAGTIQYNICEAQLWPALREQFGIMVPGPDMDAPGPARDTSGCCSAGNGPLTGAVLGLLVALGLLRRRRVA